MQQTTYAYSPYVVCMMPAPTNRMIPATTGGAVVMQVHPGMPFHPNCCGFVQIPQQELLHHYIAPGSFLTCQSTPQNISNRIEIDRSKDCQVEQRVCEKPKRKLLNKKVALNPSTVGIAKARSSRERLCRNIIRGWRRKTGDVAHEDGCDERIIPQMLASKFQEQLLRLALFGWRRTDAIDAVAPLQKPSSLIASFMSETSTALSERTHSLMAASYDSISFTERSNPIQSDIASTIGSSSLDDASTISNATEEENSTNGFGFLGHLPTWEIPRVIRGLGQQPRIGIDLGGVVFCDSAKQLIPKTLDGVRGLVKIFGAENVFIVSKVRLNGSVHEACRLALTKPGGFLEQTNIPKENVVFVSAIDGPTGKGVVSARLGLSHFVDDKTDVLHSIYADKAGNSRNFMDQFNGKLFHFNTHASKRRADPRPLTALSAIEAPYLVVSGWSELLASFGKDIDDDQAQLRTPIVTKSVVEVHRIPIDVEEDIASRIVPRVLHGCEEIETFAGVRIFLRGKGSPHPQAKSAEQDPLRVEVRTKPNGTGSLDVAIPRVRSLLKAVIASTI